MNKIYKIFLGLALFLALTGIAWAGLNYESAQNYFLIDSFLNASGNYIVVGNALNALPATVSALAVSNNLIFLKEGSQFTDYYYRKIAKNKQGYYFSTPTITVNSSSDFRIAAPGRAGFLTFISNSLIINQDFYAKNGLNIATGLTTLAPKTIAVDKVLATTFSPLKIATDPNSPLNSPAQTVLYLPALAGSKTTATTIKFGSAGKDLCQIKTWDALTSLNTNPIKQGVGTADPSPATTCDDNYFVFDMNANPDPISGLGKLVCCQATITTPEHMLDINASF